MDSKELAERLRASRRGTVQAAGATFEVTLPTDHAYRVLIESHRSPDRQLQEAKAYRAVLEEAITGWQGVTVGHVLPEGGDEPLPFTPENRALLLDHDQELIDLLTLEIWRLMKTRREARESARKNSSRASSGS